MKEALFTLLAVCMFLSLKVSAQTTATVSSGGTGWKRIASIQGTGGRGFGRVSLYTAGGSFTPSVSNIDWFHDWQESGGISVHSDAKSSPYWSAFRLTDDGTNAYIEVNFNVAVTGLTLLSDSYGWRPATLYTGTLPDGGGTVRAASNVGRLNIENNFVVNQNGRVGIGTATPTEKLAVNGTIRAKEIKVDSGPWPDYVFEEDYKMKSLTEIEAFIKTNKHLPGMPNQKQVEEEGVSLGEMNRKLLEKVEELTLLLIDKEKEMVAMKERMDSMDSKITSIQNKN